MHRKSIFISKSAFNFQSLTFLFNTKVVAYEVVAYEFRKFRENFVKNIDIRL